MARYPVFFAARRPEKFERAALLWRVGILLVLSIAGVSMGAVFGVLYLALPVVAALALSQKGSTRFLSEDAPRFARALRWVMGAYAYMLLLTDRFPNENDDIQFAVEPGAWPAASPGPSVGSALLRMIYSLPHAFVLGLLAMVSWILWLVAALLIVVTGTYPEPIHGFQCGVLRWQARLFAYHTSLVEHYPPFAFDPGAVPTQDQEPLPH